MANVDVVRVVYSSGDSVGFAELQTGETLAVDHGGTGATTLAGAGILTNTGSQTITDNSGNPALKVTQSGAGNAFVVEDAASDTTPFVIDANGKIILGHTLAIGSSLLQTYAESGSSLVSRQSSTDVNAAQWYKQKARGTTLSPISVISGDQISVLNYQGYDGAAFVTAATIKVEVDGTPGTNDMPGRLVFSTTTDDANSPTEQMRIDSSGNVMSMSATGLLGYGTGAGGTVTQATSKATAVTLNKPTGKITMNAAALAAGAAVTFVCNNSLVSIKDTVVASLAAGSIASAEVYTLITTASNGIAYFSLTNRSAGSLSEAVVLNFAIIKGASA